jgi:hypothetical protein
LRAALSLLGDSKKVKRFLQESLDHNERDAYNAAVSISPDRLTA